MNLFDDDTKLNIHQFKTVTATDSHWLTIQKYLKMMTLIQKYAPIIEINESKFRITQSRIFQHLNMKERFVIYLYTHEAQDQDTAVPLPPKYNNDIVLESVVFLYEKTTDNRYYLKPYGVDLYHSLTLMISDLIYNEKEVDEVFGQATPPSEPQEDLTYKEAKETQTKVR